MSKQVSIFGANTGKSRTKWPQKISKILPTEQHKIVWVKWANISNGLRFELLPIASTSQRLSPISYQYYFNNKLILFPFFYKKTSFALLGVNILF